MSRLFSFLRRRPTRRACSRRSPVECLESRQLLAVTPISAVEVELLLDRAAVATSSEDAIIAVVDRGGRILGVRVEEDVLLAYGSLVSADGIINTAAEEATLVYAIDGAVAKARTAAFFANGTADSRIDPDTLMAPASGTPTPTVGPLTSRTVRFISQTTITQREMQANPNESDLTKRGPGFVAPVGIGGHFPPAVPHTPQVDLFGIEHTNRDSKVHPGMNSVHETTDPTLTVIGGDDILLPGRFNTTYEPGKDLEPPESYGFTSARLMTAQSRGIATLPGGIPLYRGFDVVGGIGVFFPGTVDADGAGPQQLGDATFEQGFVPGIKQTEARRTNAPKVLEAEYIAFAAAGGAAFGGLAAKDKIGVITGLDGIPLDPSPFLLPFGRIDLVGITLQIIGPTAGVSGVRKVVAIGKQLGVGENTGANQFVTPGLDMDPTTLGDNVIVRDGVNVPEGWLVMPHAGSSLTEDNVRDIIEQGIATANATRAAIRLKVTNTTKGTTTAGARTRMVFAVTDTDGSILGLYRMHDATVFSIDVAVAKARNTAYYADAAQLILNPGDQVDDDNNGSPDVPLGKAFSNRTFRFLAEPRYPQGVDGSKQGDFSILNDPGFNTALLKSKNPTIAAGAVENLADPVSASVFSLPTASVFGYDSFNPGRNFRQTANIANQNGVIFFPGSAPLYNTLGALVGGFGVSGDGVDQDDVVTLFGVNGFRPPTAVAADQYFVRGTRLPYQKFNRNPFA